MTRGGRGVENKRYEERGTCKHAARHLKDVDDEPGREGGEGHAHAREGR